MSETATTEAVQALRSRIEAVADEVDAEADATAIRWAYEDLDRQGVRAAIIPLPETLPTRDEPQGNTFAAAPSPDGVHVWRTHNKQVAVSLSWEDAAALLPQLARLVTNHKTEQAAARERRIREYAAALHTASDVCALANDPTPCGFCERVATYAIDNPPPAA